MKKKLFKETQSRKDNKEENSSVPLSVEFLKQSEFQTINEQMIEKTS